MTTAARSLDAAAPRRTGPLTAAACASMFLFGIAAALLGATLPLLTERLQIGLGRVGTLFLVMNACMLASSFALGALHDRVSTRPTLVVAPVVVAVALLLVATAASYTALVASVALLGLAGSALNVSGNALVADLHQDPAARGAALNRVGIFYGFGALFVPLAIGLLLRAVGLRPILFGAAALCALIGAANALPAYPPPKQKGKAPAADGWRFLQDPFVLLLGLLLFFESGNEFILGGYATTFLTGTIGTSVTAASYALAGFWAALMLTRVWLGHGRSRPAPTRLVIASGFLSAAAAAALVTTSRPAVAQGAVVALGATLAGVFPSVLAAASGRYPEHSGTVFGVLFTMALCGGMSLPWVTGQAALAWGLRTALGLVSLQFLAVCLLQALAARRPAAARS